MLKVAAQDPRVNHRVASLAFVVVAGLALLGCGGGDDDASSGGDAATTTAALSDAAISIGEGAEADLGISTEEGRCFGASLVDQLGEEDAVALNESDVDPTDLPAEQSEAVRSAFNECVPGSTFAQDIVDELYSSVGASSTADPAVVDCVAERLDGKTGDVAFEGLSVDSANPELGITTAALEACVPPEVVGELLESSLVTAGLTEVQAECVSGQLAGQITLGQLIQLGASGAEIPADLQAIVDAAVTSCAAAG